MLPTHSSSLTELENIIEEGIATFYAVGSALLEIKERELYSPEYPDFETYCENRWLLNSRQVERRLQSAEIILNLDGPKPKYESHALELRRIEDPHLRNMAWSAAQERFGEEITRQNLSEIISEYVSISDPALKRLVVTQEITAKHAAELIQVLARLPEYYQESVRKFGIGMTQAVAPEALRILRRMEYTVPDEIMGILASGFVYVDGIMDIPLWSLTKDLAQYFERVIFATLNAERQAIASTVQDNSVNGAAIVSGEDYSNILNPPKGQLVWFFPERLEKETIMGLLEAAGLDVYLVVGYTKGTKINFDGESADVTKLGGVKPQALLDAIKALTCKQDSK